MTHPTQKRTSAFGKALFRRVLPVAAAALVFLNGCGTTSTLKGPQGSAVTPSHKYSKVTVQDFKVSVKEHAQEAASSAATFADIIAGEIRKNGRFAAVLRNATPDANTLVIDGVVTKYDEGSQAKRMWLGMGFGMAFLEADVRFREGKGSALGTIKVDKNSWAMGGGLAAGQNPHSFMEDAAETIAEEAAKLASR